MSKLDTKEIKRDAIHIFNTKVEMLEYIKKSSFKKDKLGYTHYRMEITYAHKKWIISWR